MAEVRKMNQHFDMKALTTALALEYFCAGKFGLSLAVVNASASSVWPLSGLVLAALLLGGHRLCPGIFIGAHLVNIATQGSVANAFGIATGNALDALTGAWLVSVGIIVLTVLAWLAVILKRRTARQHPQVREAASMGQFIGNNRAETGLSMLAAAVADSEDAIISLTMDGAIMTWNPGAQRIYGYAAEEVVSRSVAVIFPSANINKLSQILERVARGETVARYETLCRRKDGSLFESSLTVSPVNDAAGKRTGASVIARDVSERRKLEKEVLDMSTLERRRVGYELHDGLSQQLAGIALKAKSLQESLTATGASQAGAAREIVELVNEAMRQTRQVTRSLDPPEREASDLVAVLKRLALETSAAYPVDCQCRCEESQLPLTAQTNLALFHMAQEAVRNAIVHGGAERIELQLTSNNGGVNLAIRDNGKGFDPSKKAPAGMGLRLMQYRARTLDATFQLSSQPGVGTVVKCSLPLPASMSGAGTSTGEE
jgi:PAS domain S-box-containing protein